MEHLKHFPDYQYANGIYVAFVTDKYIRLLAGGFDETLKWIADKFPGHAIGFTRVNHLRGYLFNWQRP